MLALLLSSVSASAIIAATPEPPVTGYTATPHTVPTAPYWRCRFWGAASNAYFSVAGLEFRDTYGGASITSGGTPIASAERSGFEKALAFDGDANTAWSVARPPDGPWLGYQFSSPVKIREIAITARLSFQTHTPTVIAVEASQDGVTWEHVELWTRQDLWNSGETDVFRLGSGYFRTDNTRSGFNTDLDDEVMGQVFTADHDFTITQVKTFLNTPRRTHAVVARVHPSTYAIEEVLTVSDELTDSTFPEAEITPVQIAAGQTFAILFYCTDAEPSKNVQVRYVTDDFYPIMATPVANWVQLNKNVAVGATPDATSDVDHSIVFFRGVFRNGEGSFPSGAMPVPDIVPFPAGWYSPEVVTLDGSGVVTAIPNLGWRGNNYDATPTSGKAVTVTDLSRFWGYKNIFEIPDTSGGFAAGTGFVAKSFVGITTYGSDDAPDSFFADYAGYVSGPVGGSTNELELVGFNGQNYFFTGKVDTILVDDHTYNDDDRDPALPLVKKAVGGIEITDGYEFGMLWADNFSGDRNWKGISGDVLVFEEALGPIQLRLIGRHISDHFTAVQEASPMEAATLAVLGGGGLNTLAGTKARAFSVLGGGGEGTIGVNTSNVYAVIQE